MKRIGMQLMWSIVIVAMAEVDAFAGTTAEIKTSTGMVEKMSIREDKRTDAGYNVSYRGKRIELQPCRISAMPYNEIWKGTQRPLDQTRDAFFVQIENNEDSELMIDGFAPDERTRFSPMSERSRFVCEKDRIKIRIDGVGQYVIDFGENAPPLHIFVEEPFVYHHVPGELYFGPGEHDVGVIAPTNGQTVCFDRGAVVYGSLFLDRVTNVTVVGRGVLDCSRFERADPRAQEFRKSRGLPPIDTEFACHACVVYASSKVKFKDFVIRDTPFWALIVRSGSEDVDIDGIKIIGQWRYNSDGIDISASSNVKVRNCFLRTFDDCMVVLGAYLDTRSFTAENIVFKNNTCWCDWGASFKLWSQPYTNTFRNIVVRDCRFLSTFDYAIQVKDSCGSADTEICDLKFENIEIDYPVYPTRTVLSDRVRPYPGYAPVKKICPVYVSCEKPKRDFGNQDFRVVENPTGYHSHIHDIVFRDFHCYGEVPELEPRFFTALKEGQTIERVSFENCPDFKTAKGAWK